MSQVKGYTQLTPQQIELANEGKELEERYLRWLDKVRSTPTVDYAMAERARTNIQQGAMWAIRAIFKPERIELPEDHSDNAE